MKKTKKPYGQENDLNLKLVIGLSRTAVSMHRATQTFLAGYGLTLAQFGVLEVLYHRGDLKICEIIEKTLSTSGNMTVVIKNLERDGFVIRTNNPEDLRVHYIQLTEQGRRLLDDIFPKHLEGIDAFFSKLNSEEKEQLVKLLKKNNGVE